MKIERKIKEYDRNEGGEERMRQKAKRESPVNNGSQMVWKKDRLVKQDDDDDETNK